MKPRLAIGLLIVAALAAVLWFGSSFTGGRLPPAAESSEEPDPGYAARDAQIIETDADGREVYRLNAELIRQDPDSGIVELESIKMDYRTAANALWNIDAMQGQVAASGTEIALRGKVRVAGPVGVPGRKLQLESEQLQFQTEQELITTEAVVVMRWEGQELRARGLVANLKTERVRLKSNVHGRFIP